MPSIDSCTYGDATEPIAIVGMASRFPGEASTLLKFWDMMIHGRTGHSRVPADRYDTEAWYHPSHERKGTVCPSYCCNSFFFFFFFPPEIHDY